MNYADSRIITQAAIPKSRCMHSYLEFRKKQILSQFQNYYKTSHRRKSVLRKEPKILYGATVAPGGLENSIACLVFAGTTTTDF